MLIPLSNSKLFTEIDDDCYEYPFEYVKLTGESVIIRPCDELWYVNSKTGYAHAMKNFNGVSFNVSLHRLIVEPVAGRLLDHINQNKLDNRIQNLQWVTCSQNLYNRPKTVLGGSSRYKGVSWVQNKWRAAIKVNSKSYHLGLFHCEEDAARTYDAALKHHYPQAPKLAFNF